MYLWKGKYLKVLTGDEVAIIDKMRSGAYHLRRNPPKGVKRKKSGVVPSEGSNLVHVKVEGDTGIKNQQPDGMGRPEHIDKEYSGNAGDTVAHIDEDGTVSEGSSVG